MGVLDINEDGWLSSAEVRAVSRKGAWTQMDVSRDGKVDLVESRRFLDNENPIKPMLEKRRDLKMMSKRHKVFKGKSQTRTPRP